MPTMDEKYSNLLKASEILNDTEELTDDTVDEISECMDEVGEETGENPSKLGDYIPTEEDLNMEKIPQQIDVNIDPVTGKINNVIAPETYKDHKLTLDELLEMDFDKVRTELDITEESVKDSLGVVFPNFKEEDVPVFLNALNKYRKGEKVSYFNLLPESMKNGIDAIVGQSQIGYASQREARNYVIEGLFEQIIQDNYSNKIVTDLNQSLEESYKQLYEDTKGDFSKYNNNQRYIYETYLLEYADKIQEEDSEKADLCRKIHDKFVESYTYEDMYNLYKNTGKLRVKKIEVEKFEKTCLSWLYKYSNHKMVINNLSDTFPVLKSELAEFGFSDDTLKKFIVIFTKYSMNMSPDNVDEHVYMYYFIKNILSLKYYNKDDEEEIKFYDKVRHNLIKFLELIEEKDQKGVN